MFQFKIYQILGTKSREKSKKMNLPVDLIFAQGLRGVASFSKTSRVFFEAKLGRKPLICDARRGVAGCPRSRGSGQGNKAEQMTLLAGAFAK